MDALLLVLAVIGGLFTITALVYLAMEIVVYLVAGIKVFTSKVNATIECWQKIKADKKARKEKIKAIKEEVTETKTVLEDIVEVKEELQTEAIPTEIQAQ